MAYKIEKVTIASSWLATMRLSIPDFSRTYDKRLMHSMRSELKRLGVRLSTPEYNYMIGFDSEENVELVDVIIYVSVQAPVKMTTNIEFIENQSAIEAIRITADSFEDVHIGLAEWMHENDYVAAGDMRRVLVEDENIYVFDSPVKPSRI